MIGKRTMNQIVKIDTLIEERMIYQVFCKLEKGGSLSDKLINDIDRFQSSRSI